MAKRLEVEIRVSPMPETVTLRRLLAEYRRCEAARDWSRPPDEMRVLINAQAVLALEEQLAVQVERLSLGAPVVTVPAGRVKQPIKFTGCELEQVLLTLACGHTVPAAESWKQGLFASHARCPDHDLQLVRSERWEYVREVR